jgi:hypothetical protein
MDDFMKLAFCIKWTAASLLAALVAACGGGGGGGAVAPDAPQVPWSSPAMILPAGAASKTIALEACDGGLGSVTLVVTAAGDMILNGAPTGQGIQELRRINFATSTNSIVKGQNTVSGPGVSIELINGDDTMQASVGLGDDSFYSSFYDPDVDGYSYITCSVSNPSTAFFLNALPSSARLAKEMLNGITGLTNRAIRAGNTFTGGVVFWDNWPAFEPESPTQADRDIRHFSLNMSTGVFGTSPNPNVVGTTYNVTIPTTPTSTLAYFSEIKAGGNKKFVARIDAATPSSARVNVCLFREGDVLTPNDWNNCTKN